MIFDDKLIKQAVDSTDEALITRYQNGEHAVVNALFDRHKDLIKYKTRGYQNIPIPTQAVYGQGMKILAVAAKNFDEGAGVKFRTFLESNLRGLARYTHANKNVLHFPQNKMLKIKSYQATYDLLSQKSGKAPEDWKMADALGWSIPEVAEFRSKLSQRELASSGLDNVVGRQQQDESTVSRQFEKAEFLYYSLTDKEKQVYDYSLGRHGKPKLKTDALISLRTGLSPSKVNRVRKDLAHRIQNHI